MDQLEALQQEHVQKLYSKREAERARLCARIEQTKRQLDEFGPFPLFRARCEQMRRDVAAMEREVAVLDGLQPEEEARAEIEPYRRAMELANSVQEVVGGTKGKRNWKTTTYSVTPAGRRSRVRDSNTRAVSRTTLADVTIDRYRSEVLGYAPPRYVDEPGLCTRCHAPLSVVIEGSTSACVSCKRLYFDPPQPAIGENVAPAASNRSNGLGVRGSDSAHQESRLIDAIETGQAKQSNPPPQAKLVALADHMWNTGQSGLEDDLPVVYEAWVRRGRKDWQSVQEAAEDLPAEVVAKLFAMDWKTVRRVQSTMSKQERGGKSYDNCPRLAAALTGILPPQMPAQLQETLIRLFRFSKPVYDSFGKQNGNFPGGYPNWIGGALLLLGHDEFLPYYNVQGTGKHEDTRRKIYDKLTWEFLPLDEPPPPIRVLTPGETAEDAPQPPPPRRAESPRSAKRLRRVKEAPKPVKRARSPPPSDNAAVPPQEQEPR
jgi:hypothetical protein